ncbi:F/Y rich C-terminus-domain-containing protein [Circinella umbellata]|nr:F/Y rich C-terminus-domain-containing protein [Circinella umbellata]
MLQDGRMVPSSRPKRMRRGPVEPKMRRVQPLEKDPVSGEYKLPARVGILTVHSLGRVVPLPTYHNDRYIWPPGFKVSRTYLSMVNPNANTVYTCSVEENGEQGPRFRVVADDCPDQPIIANSATGVWTAIVKRANEIRHRDHSNSASGPDYYGFTHATIAKMIQDLPGTENCINYVWQKFGVMHQRTAAGVAAAAQKKLTNLEIMGSANKRPPPLHQQDRDDFTIMEHPEDFINGPLSTQEQRHHHHHQHHHAAEIELPRPQPVSTTAAVAAQEPIRLIQVRQSSSTADT